MKGYQYQSDFAKRYVAEGRAEGLAEGLAEGEAKEAAAILDELVLSRDFLPFLTLIAYPRLD